MLKPFGLSSKVVFDDPDGLPTAPLQRLGCCSPHGAFPVMTMSFGMFGSGVDTFAPAPPTVRTYPTLHSTNGPRAPASCVPEAQGCLPRGRGTAARAPYVRQPRGVPYVLRLYSL